MNTKAIIYFVICLLSFIYSSNCYADLLNWQTTEGIIKTSQVEETSLKRGDAKTFELKLTYEYQVNNKQYINEKFINLDRPIKHLSIDPDFENLKSTLAINQPIKIKYSPSFPAISKFEPEWTKVKAKIVLFPEFVKVNCLSEEQFIVLDYPEIYYEYFTNGKTFRNKLDIIGSKTKAELDELKNKVKPFRFNWIHNLENRIKLNGNNSKCQIAKDYTKERFITELNDSLSRRFSVEKGYQEGIDIYIDQNNPEIVFFEKPTFGKLADLLTRNQEAKALQEGSFKSFGIWFSIMIFMGLPFAILVGIAWFVQYLAAENCTRVAKNFNKTEILNDTEALRKEIFDNTLKQINDFLDGNEETIYNFEKIRITWFRVFISTSLIFSFLIIIYFAYLQVLDLYNGASSSFLFVHKVIFALLVFHTANGLLSGISSIPLLISWIIRIILYLTVISGIFSGYFFIALPLVFVPACIKACFQFTKNLILNKKYQIDFKHQIIQKLLITKFQQLHYEPENYISKNTIENSGLFYVNGYHSGDDLIIGQSNGLNFSFSEIHLNNQLASKSRGDFGKPYGEAFDGLFIEIEIPKEHNGIFGTNPKFGDEIFLDYPEFNSFFHVYGDNTAEIFYILSTNVLDKLIDLQINLGKLDISFSIISKQAYFAIHSQKDFLEAPTFNSLWNTEVYFEYIKIINFIDNLTYSFKERN